MLLIIVALWGCDENMEFPPEPAISFESILWQPGTNGSDSLVLTFYFEDGDADLGLYQDEVDAPYHPFDLVVDANNELVTISSEVDPPFYSLTPEGTRVPFSIRDVRMKYDERNYLLVDSANAANTNAFDTLLIRRNVFHNNIYLKCFKKEDGAYQVCDDFYPEGERQIVGRFPRVDPIFNQQPPLGKVSFQFAARDFLRVVRADTFRFQFHIFDRELNQSNLATSPDLTIVDMIRTSN
ncbi:MAG: hypothetical protein AAGA85_05725 [Bacteroidota bacterium]